MDAITLYKPPTANNIIFSFDIDTYLLCVGKQAGKLPV